MQHSKSQEIKRHYLHPSPSTSMGSFTSERYFCKSMLVKKPDESFKAVNTAQHTLGKPLHSLILRVSFFYFIVDVLPYQPYRPNNGK
jgi:hypothetical protein